MRATRRGHKKKPTRKAWHKRMGSMERAQEEEEEEGVENHDSQKESYIVSIALYRLHHASKRNYQEVYTMEDLRQVYYDGMAFYFLLKYLFCLKIAIA